jgi:hypothetical protein
MNQVVILCLLFLCLGFQDCLSNSAAWPSTALQVKATPKKDPLIPISHLSGTFIQYQNAMMRWNWQWAPGGKPYPIDWQALLQTINNVSTENDNRPGLGMNTLIIKRLATPKVDLPIPTGEDDEFYRVDNDAPQPVDIGPTETILSYADSHQIDVYVGLWEDENFTYAKINDTYLKAAAEKNKQLAKKVWPLFRTHPSFKGWYIPNEMWNIRSADLEKAKLLGRFLSSISKFLKNDLTRPSPLQNKARAMQILIAPYFNPRVDKIHSPPDEVRSVYGEILKDSGVNVVVLQDRVGALGWNPVKDHLRYYFEAFRETCKSANPQIDLWAVVEIFESDGINTKPSDGSHLKDQLCIESGYAAKTIAFDYYHFMNPVVPDAGAPIERAALGGFVQRKKLYNFYRSNFIDKVQSCR